MFKDMRSKIKSATVDRQRRYGIRKLTVGTTSVLLGTFLAMHAHHHTVHASVTDSKIRTHVAQLTKDIEDSANSKAEVGIAEQNAATTTSAATSTEETTTLNVSDLETSSADAASLEESKVQKTTGTTDVTNSTPEKIQNNNTNSQQVEGNSSTPTSDVSQLNANVKTSDTAADDIESESEAKAAANSFNSKIDNDIEKAINDKLQNSDSGVTYEQLKSWIKANSHSIAANYDNYKSIIEKANSNTNTTEELNKYIDYLIDYKKQIDQAKQDGTWNINDQENSRLIDPLTLQQGLDLGDKNSTAVTGKVESEQSAVKETAVDFKNDNRLYTKREFRHFVSIDNSTVNKDEDLFTVTYEGNDGAYYQKDNGDKVHVNKITITFSDWEPVDKWNSNFNQYTDNNGKQQGIQPGIYIGDNPLKGFYYYGAKSLTFDIQLYDSNGDLIHIGHETTDSNQAHTGAFLTVKSLNSSGTADEDRRKHNSATGQKQSYVEKAQIMSTGTALAFPESSVTPHTDEKGHYTILYSDKDNNGVDNSSFDDNRFNDWSYTKSSADGKQTIETKPVEKFENWDSQEEKEIFGAGVFAINDDHIKIKISSDMGSAWVNYSVDIPKIVTTTDTTDDGKENNNSNSSANYNFYKIHYNAPYNIHYIDVTGTSSTNNDSYTPDLGTEITEHEITLVGRDYDDSTGSYTAPTLWDYSSEGYALVSEDDDLGTQNISENTPDQYVYLRKVATEVPESTKTVTRTIHFKSDTGETLAPDQVQTVTYTRDAYYVDYNGNPVNVEKDGNGNNLVISSTNVPSWQATNGKSSFDEVDDPTGSVVGSTVSKDTITISSGNLKGTWIKNGVAKASDVPTPESEASWTDYTKQDDGSYKAEDITLVYYQAATQQTDTKTATRTIHFVANDENHSQLADDVKQTLSYTSDYYVDGNGKEVAVKDFTKSDGSVINVVDNTKTAPDRVWKLETSTGSTNNDGILSFDAVSDPSGSVYRINDDKSITVTDGPLKGTWTKNSTVNSKKIAAPIGDGSTWEDANDNVTLIYTKDVNADIIYIDDTDNNTLFTDKDTDEHGKVDDAITFSTTPSTKIKDYEGQGYVLVSDNFDSSNKQYQDGNNHFEIHFVHGTNVVPPSKTPDYPDNAKDKNIKTQVTQQRLIKYFDGDTNEAFNGKYGVEDQTQSVTWGRTAIYDAVTGYLLGYAKDNKISYTMYDKDGNITTDESKAVHKVATADGDGSWTVISKNSDYLEVDSPDLTGYGYKAERSLTSDYDAEDSGKEATEKAADPTKDGGEVDIYYFHDIVPITSTTTDVPEDDKGNPIVDPETLTKEASRNISFVSAYDNSALQDSITQRIKYTGTAYVDRVTKEQVNAIEENGRYVQVDKDQDPKITWTTDTTQNFDQNINGFDKATQSTIKKDGKTWYLVQDDENNKNISGLTLDNNNWPEVKNATLKYKTKANYNVHYIDLGNSNKTTDFAPADGTELTDHRIADIGKDNYVGNIPNASSNLWQAHTEDGKGYEDLGYVLIQADNNLANQKLTDDVQDQYVYLSHGTESVTENATATETIDYKYQSGPKAGEQASANYTKVITYTRKGTKDKVTGNIITYDQAGWQADSNFEIVTSPKIVGYSVDHSRVVTPKVDTASLKAGENVQLDYHVLYNIDQQKMMISYIDDTTGQTLKADQLTGDSDSQSNYSTDKTINEYIAAGYVLLSDNTNERKDHNNLLFDHDKDVDQAYEVHLKHDTKSQSSESHTITRTIKYQGTRDGGKTFQSIEGLPEITQSVTFSRTEIRDKVNNNLLGYDTNSDGQVDVSAENGDKAWIVDGKVANSFTFDNVSSKKPEDINYSAVDIPEVEASTVGPNSSNPNDITVTYNYYVNSQIEYVDDTTGETLISWQNDSDSNGIIGNEINFAVKPSYQIQALKDKGYVLVRNDFGDGKEYKDGDNKFEVHFIHGTTTAEDNTTAKRNINYVDGTTNTALDSLTDETHPVTQTVNYKQIAVRDAVTGETLGYTTNAEDKDENGRTKVDSSLNATNGWFAVGDNNNFAAKNSPDLTRFGYRDGMFFANGSSASTVSNKAVELDENGKPKDGEDVTVYYYHDTTLQTSEQTVTRKITYRGTKDGGKTYEEIANLPEQTQSVTFHRTEIIDNVTHKSLGYDINGDGIADENAGDGWMVNDQLVNKYEFAQVDSKDANEVGYTTVDTNQVSSQTVKPNDENPEDIVITYNYYVPSQISFYDDTDNVELSNLKLTTDRTGVIGNHINFDITDLINTLESKGYTLVRDGFAESDQTYHDGDNKFEVHLIHNQAEQAPETIQRQRTINYYDGQTGESLANVAPSITQTVSYQRIPIKDEVTGKTIGYAKNGKIVTDPNEAWMLTDGLYAAVDSPNLTQLGYRETPSFQLGKNKGDAATAPLAQADALKDADDVNIHYFHDVRPEVEKTTVKRNIYYWDGTTNTRLDDKAAPVTQTEEYYRIKLYDAVTNEFLGYQGKKNKKTHSFAIVANPTQEKTWLPTDGKASFHSVDSPDLTSFGYKSEMLFADQTSAKKAGHAIISYDENGNPMDVEDVNIYYFHDTEPVNESATVTHTIDFTYANGPKEGQNANDNRERTVTYTRTGIRDKVTGEVIYENDGDWTADDYFRDVTSPNHDGYQADKNFIQAPVIKASELKDGDNQHKKTHVKYYLAEQKMSIVYIDDDTNQTLKTDVLKGYSNSESGYTTQDEIKDYEGQGYILVSDSTDNLPDYNNLKFDDDTNVDQDYEVHLKRVSDDTFVPVEQPDSSNDEDPITPAPKAEDYEDDFYATIKQESIPKVETTLNEEKPTLEIAPIRPEHIDTIKEASAQLQTDKSQKKVKSSISNNISSEKQESEENTTSIKDTSVEISSTTTKSTSQTSEKGNATVAPFAKKELPQTSEKDGKTTSIIGLAAITLGGLLGLAGSKRKEKDDD